MAFGPPPDIWGWGPNLPCRGFTEFIVYLGIFFTGMALKNYFEKTPKPEIPVGPQLDAPLVDEPYNWSNFSLLDLSTTAPYRDLRRRCFGDDRVALLILLCEIASAVGAILSLCGRRVDRCSDRTSRIWRFVKGGRSKG